MLFRKQEKIDVLKQEKTNVLTHEQKLNKEQKDEIIEKLDNSIIQKQTSLIVSQKEKEDITNIKCDYTKQLLDTFSQKNKALISEINQLKLGKYNDKLDFDFILEQINEDINKWWINIILKDAYEYFESTIKTHIGNNQTGLSHLLEIYNEMAKMDLSFDWTIITDPNIDQHEIYKIIFNYFINTLEFFKNWLESFENSMFEWDVLKDNFKDDLLKMAKIDDEIKMISSDLIKALTYQLSNIIIDQVFIDHLPGFCLFLSKNLSWNDKKYEYINNTLLQTFRKLSLKYTKDSETTFEDAIKPLFNVSKTKEYDTSSQGEWYGGSINKNTFSYKNNSFNNFSISNFE